MSIASVSESIDYAESDGELLLEIEQLKKRLGEK